METLSSLAQSTHEFNFYRNITRKYDAKIRRFVEIVGSLQLCPNELVYYERIRENFREAMRIQQERCIECSNLYREVELNCQYLKKH